MELMMACGTWIKTESQRKVLAYIQSCDIFPTPRMIADATGVPETYVRHTLYRVAVQEGMYVNRQALFMEEAGADMTNVTRRDLLIQCLMERTRRRADPGADPDVAAFLEQNRYYDESGAVRCRFTEEQVRHALRCGRPDPSEED